MNKSEIDEYFKERFKYLEGIAANIVKKKNRHSINVQDDKHDLFMYMIDGIYSNIDKFIEFDKRRFEGYCIMVMKNQWTWSKTDYHKLFDILPSEDITIEPSEDITVINHLLAEDASQRAKDYIQDLLSKFNEDQISRILKIKIAKSQLSMEHRLAYEYYFEQMLSMRDIAHITNIPLSSVHRMVNSLKKKIKELCGI